jgi:hypothetical protein
MANIIVSCLLLVSNPVNINIIPQMMASMMIIEGILIIARQVKQDKTRYSMKDDKVSPLLVI